MRHSIRIGPYHVGVRSTSAAVGAWLEEALGAYLTDEEADGNMFSVVVAESSANRPGPAKQYHILYRHTLAVIRSFDLKEIGRSLLGEVAKLRFSERDDLLFAEAGLLWKGDDLALIPGTAPLFVHTVGRRLERAGYRLGDQAWVAIDPETGLITPPDGLIPGIELLDGLASIAPAAEEAGDRRILQSAVAPQVVCSMSWDRGVVGTSRAVGAHRLATHVMNFPPLGQRALDGLAHLVRNASCYAVGTRSAKEVLDGFGAALDGREVELPSDDEEE